MRALVFEHLDTICVAHDARYFGAGAQRVGDFCGFPMGVHINHGCFLQELSGALITWRRLAQQHCALSRTDGHHRLCITGTSVGGEGCDARLCLLQFATTRAALCVSRMLLVSATAPRSSP